MKKFSIVLSMAFIFLSIFALCVSAEEVFYQNDFSDAATLADFQQYRGAWEIKDGALYCTSETSNDFTWIMFKPTEVLTDYVVEVDYMNHKVMGGIVARADFEKVSEKDNNSFYGYLGFVSNDGTKVAMGASNTEGTYANFAGKVSTAVSEVGQNIHIRFAVVGTKQLVSVTDLATGKVLMEYDNEDATYASGTFGLRMRMNGTEGYFDNLKVTKVDATYNMTAVAVETTAATTAATTAEDLSEDVTERYEYVVWEDDFTDPAKMSNYTAVRGTWKMANGQLSVDKSGAADQEENSYAHITWNGGEELTDYIIEVDYKDATTGGIIWHCQNPSDKTSNSFNGYVTGWGVSAAIFIGYGNEDGYRHLNKADGKSSVTKIDKGLYPDVHVKVVVEGTKYSAYYYDMATNTLIKKIVCSDDASTKGTFGLRLFINLETNYAGYFQNFKVTAINDCAKTLAAKAGETAAVVSVASENAQGEAVDPNAPVTELTFYQGEDTTAPDEATTEKATSAASEEATSGNMNKPAKTTGADTDAAVAPAAEGGNPALVWIIVAAVAVVAIVVVVIIVAKKKKTDK